MRRLTSISSDSPLRNAIEADGAGCFAGVLAQCPALTHPNLSYNDIQDDFGDISSPRSSKYGDISGTHSECALPVSATATVLMPRYAVKLSTAELYCIPNFLL